MPQIPTTNEAFEGSLQEFGAEVREVQRTPEAAQLNESELVRRSLRSYAERASAASPAAPEESLPTTHSSPLPSYLDSGTADPAVVAEVESLITLAFTHGLRRAFGAARRPSPFIEDAFHDALAEKLLPELKRRGLIS